MFPTLLVCREVHSPFAHTQHSAIAASALLEAKFGHPVSNDHTELVQLPYEAKLSLASICTVDQSWAGMRLHP